MSVRPTLLAAASSGLAAETADPSTRVLIAAGTSILLTSMAVAAVYMTQPLFGAIATRFAIPPDAARSAFAWPLLSYAVVFFMVGPLSDRLRASSLASGGGLLLGLLLLAAGEVGNFDVFVASLVAAGAMAACVPAATFALMARIAPPPKLGLYFGLGIASTVVGVTLGRTVGALLAGWIGLTGLFTVAGLTVIVTSCALLLARAPDSPPAATTSLLATYGRTLAILGDRRVSGLLGVGVLLFFGYLGLLTFLTYRLQREPFLYSTAQIGWISVTGLVAVVGAPGSGALIRIRGARSIALGSLLIVLAGLVVLGLASDTPMVAVGLIALFLGVFSCQPAILVLLSSCVAPTSKGAIASLYLLACLIGGSVASLILGRVWVAFGWSGVTTAAVASVCLSLGLVAAHRS